MKRFLSFFLKNNFLNDLLTKSAMRLDADTKNNLENVLTVEAETEIQLSTVGKPSLSNKMQTEIESFNIFITQHVLSL